MAAAHEHVKVACPATCFILHDTTTLRRIRHPVGTWGHIPSERQPHYVFLETAGPPTYICKRRRYCAKRRLWLQLCAITVLCALRKIAKLRGFMPPDEKSEVLPETFYLARSYLVSEALALLSDSAAGGNRRNEGY